MLYQLCQLKETGLFLKKCTVLLYRNTLIISYLTCGLALQWFSKSELVPTNQQIKYMKKKSGFYHSHNSDIRCLKQIARLADIYMNESTFLEKE